MPRSCCWKIASMRRARSCSRPCVWRPNHAVAVHILGVIEMESGNLEEAARLIKRTTELEPHVHDPFYFLGLTYAHLGRHAEAVEAFEAALALKPDLRMVLRQLSESLEVLGRKDEARAAIHRRLALDAKDYGALYQLVRLDPGGVSAEDRARLEAAIAGDDLPEESARRLGRAGRYLRGGGPGGQGLPASEARQRYAAPDLDPDRRQIAVPDGQTPRQDAASYGPPQGIGGPRPANGSHRACLRRGLPQALRWHGLSLPRADLHPRHAALGQHAHRADPLEPSPGPWRRRARDRASRR